MSPKPLRVTALTLTLAALASPAWAQAAMSCSDGLSKLALRDPSGRQRKVTKVMQAT